MTERAATGSCVAAGRVPFPTLSRAVVAALLGIGVACRALSEPPPPVVEFGVMFGGDVQDRTKIYFEPSAEKQELALRVTFPSALTRETLVSWELERPSKVRSPDGGIAYSAEIGERRARPGERRVEAQLRFRRGDPLGTWRIRVRIDGRVALERPFEVAPPPK